MQVEREVVLNVQPAAIPEIQVSFEWKLGSAEGVELNSVQFDEAADVNLRTLSIYEILGNQMDVLPADQATECQAKAHIERVPYWNSLTAGAAAQPQGLDHSLKWAR
ncbi:MAG: hypothetical protein QXP01_01495 [Candidatus Hadarchaeum sp.]